MDEEGDGWSSGEFSGRCSLGGVCIQVGFSPHMLPDSRLGLPRTGEKEGSSARGSPSAGGGGSWGGGMGEGYMDDCISQNSGVISKIISPEDKAQRIRRRKRRGRRKE